MKLFNCAPVKGFAIMCFALTSVQAAAPAPATDSVDAASDPSFAHKARSAEVVFEGTVVEIGPPPAAWSGDAASFQTVTYRVTKIVVDRNHQLPAGGQVKIRHLIVAQSKTADPKRPRLNPSLVSMGASVIVLAISKDDFLRGIDERDGIAPNDAAHRAMLPKP